MAVQSVPEGVGGGPEQDLPQPSIERGMVSLLFLLMLDALS